MAEERAGFEGWAILELMGHRRLAGMVSEALVAGSPFLRIDVPDGDGPMGPMVATQFYAAGAVYAITPTTEEMARKVAALGRVEPVTPWELRIGAPSALPAVGGDEDGEEAPF